MSSQVRFRTLPPPLLGRCLVATHSLLPTLCVATGRQLSGSGTPSRWGTSGHWEEVPWVLLYDSERRLVVHDESTRRF